MILLRRKEKEALVIKLIKEGKTYRDIAKVVHISLIEIKKIIDKSTGDVDSNPEDQKKKNQRNYHHTLVPFKCSKKDMTLKML